MPIAYSINREKKLIVEVWTDEIQSHDVAAYWKRYLSDPEVLAIRRTVVDLRAADICFSGLDFCQLIHTLVTPVLQGRGWTTAIVVSEPSQFGVSRQYQAFAELYSKDSIFSSMEEAERWISAIQPT